MKLLIAIPALNEERSIEGTIRACLQARAYISANSPVTEVEITAVSDGSSDRTVELAGQFRDRIKLIVFQENQGYGAAIKEAWRRSDADLLGFLDADGTCDPRFFSELCRTILAVNADVALGCRMTRDSKMPAVRRLGNFVFASMLRVLSSERVRDTASGMRVVRRESLFKLLPLPDGLHFTPAMSARALASRHVKMVEIDMPYHERTGTSKLKVGKDGILFARSIVDASLLYRPSRPLAILGLGWLALAVGLMITPALHYLTHWSIQEWMIYRFVVSHLAGANAVLFLCASYLSARMVHVALGRSEHPIAGIVPVGALFSSRFFWLLPATLLLLGAVLVIPSFLELVRTGATYEHWSRFVAMSLLWLTASILVVTRVVDYIMDLVCAQLAYSQSRDGSCPQRQSA